MGETETVCQKPGGSEIWDRKDRNNDSKTSVVSNCLVPTREGSSGSKYHPVGTTQPTFHSRNEVRSRSQQSGDFTSFTH